MSRILPRGSFEEQQFLGYLSEALEPHLKPEAVAARERRRMLSDKLWDADVALSGATPDATSATLTRLRADLDAAAAAWEGNWPTDEDCSVWIAEAVVELLGQRAQGNFAPPYRFRFSVDDLGAQARSNPR